MPVVFWERCVPGRLFVGEFCAVLEGVLVILATLFALLLNRRRAVSSDVPAVQVVFVVAAHPHGSCDQVRFVLGPSRPAVSERLAYMAACFVALCKLVCLVPEEDPSTVGLRQHVLAATCWPFFLQSTEKKLTFC